MKNRFRTLSGPYKVLEKIISVLVPLTGVVFVLNLPMLLFGASIFPQQYLGIFLGLLLGLLYLILPAKKNLSMEEVPWYDLVFCFFSMAIGIYVGIKYPTLIVSIGVLTTYKTVIGTIFLLLILEGTRRLSGWMLIAVVGAFVLYYKFGYLMPGILQISEVSYGRLVAQLFLGADAVFGVALRTVVMIVFSFILFANVLFTTGGAQFIFNIATKIMGPYRGGSAKTTIIAGSMFGLLTGSPVADVAATGPLTIPMMKESGYGPEFSSAVCATAATGACISPPILGAAAFIISEFLRVPYTEVVLVAIVPAVLYYLSLFIQSDLRAAKYKLKGVPTDGLPPMFKILLSGWYFIIPFIVLIICIFSFHFRPETAAFYAMVSVILIGLSMKETRKNLLRVMDICVATCRGMFEIAVICGAAGFIVGIMTYSGLGLTLIRIITDLAGGSLLVLVIMSAVVSTILAMGMPVTASYLVMALLVVPAMTALGVPGLAAHMFVFYYAAFSFITPPVCVAVIAASAIGGSHMLRTSLQACKLAIPGFILPFLFVFNPPVALIGEPFEIVREIGFALVAVIAICIFLEGYVKEKLSVLLRGLFCVVAACLFLPFSPLVCSIAVVLFFILMVISFISGNKNRQLQA